MSVHIGLVGAVGSGKGVATEVLKRSFDRVVVQTYSDLIREELRLKGIPADRNSLHNQANYCRRRYGNGYWATRAIIRIPDDDDITIIHDGIRNSGEIIRLRQSSSPAFIIAFVASEEMRLKRLLLRQRDVDRLDRDELLAMMREEMTEEESWGFQLQKCIEMADFTVDGECNRVVAEVKVWEIAQVISEKIELLRGR